MSQRSLEPVSRAELLDNLRWKKFHVLSGGFVCLVDVMGDDDAIVQAARVSYGEGTKQVSDDAALIRYLMRHRHSTPFEMAEVKLLVKVPMDCWRQWIRHRTANVNEYSTRYSEAIDEMDTTEPQNWRVQSTANKQGSGGYIGANDDFPEGLTRPEDCAGLGLYLSGREQEFHVLSRELYQERLAAGVAREQARKDLPLSTYTLAYWKVDLHNLFHFLSLRMDSHAQAEIRDYATTIGEQIVKPLFPVAWDAFEKYRLNATVLTGPAQAVLAKLIEFRIRYSPPWGQEHFIDAVKLAHPDWMQYDAAGNVKKHREREEVLATLQELRLIQR